jgi:hypothetical protein
MQFLRCCYENSGNSGETAGGPAVLTIPEPSKAQDFRGERDVIR